MEVKCDCGAHVVLALNRPQGASITTVTFKHKPESLCAAHTGLQKVTFEQGLVWRVSGPHLWVLTNDILGRAGVN